MKYAAFALLAATTAHADSSWEPELTGGLFVTAPEYSDEDKRVRRPRDDGDEFPETRFVGITVTFAAQYRVRERIALFGELSAMFGRPSEALVERVGVRGELGHDIRVTVGVGLQQLVLGTNEEGVGKSLHWNPLLHVAVDRAFAHGLLVRIGFDAIRICSNYGGCDFSGDGAPSRAGSTFNMIAATVAVGYRW